MISITRDIILGLLFSCTIQFIVQRNVNMFWKKTWVEDEHRLRHARGGTEVFSFYKQYLKYIYYQNYIVGPADSTALR